jgi:glutathione S-transferase
MALRYSNIEVEIREISLKEKPASMIAVSPKATVPVLVLASGQVIEQSLDIMNWALEKSDIDHWNIQNSIQEELISVNDGSFKQALDKYKYAIRFPEHPAEVYRAEGELFLKRLESLLEQNTYLLRSSISKRISQFFLLYGNSRWWMKLGLKLPIIRCLRFGLGLY